MSENLREQAGWRKGKTPIIQKYIDDHAKVMVEIAGRGFLFLPGYAYDAVNSLELTAKTGLSELNFKILEETITRELKQLGLDYGLAFKNAAITWEIEKQDLMSAWGAEYAGIKQGEASEEEVLNLLAIEVGKRSIILLEGKTAIEIEAEGYRNTLASLDGTVSPYEVQLANAKLLTAQKKLEIIPVIQEIIVKEQELLAIEQTKAAAYTDYIAAEQEVSEKKETLTPVINELATKADEYARLISSDQIPKERLIAEEKIAQARIAVEKAGLRVQELTVEIGAETKGIELADAKRGVEIARFGNEQEILSTEKSLTDALHNKGAEVFDAIIEDERVTAAELRGDKQTVHTAQKGTRLESVTTITTNDIRADGQITDNQAWKMRTVAAAEAVAKITASLKHIIG